MLTTQEAEWQIAIETDSSFVMLQVYADWLEDHGDEKTAGWRWCATLGVGMPESSFGYPGRWFVHKLYIDDTVFDKLHPEFRQTFSWLAYYDSRYTALVDLARAYVESRK